MTALACSITGSGQAIRVPVRIENRSAAVVAAHEPRYRLHPSLPLATPSAPSSSVEDTWGASVLPGRSINFHDVPGNPEAPGGSVESAVARLATAISAMAIPVKGQMKFTVKAKEFAFGVASGQLPLEVFGHSMPAGRWWGSAAECDSAPPGPDCIFNPSGNVLTCR